jgi:uncharacterized alkaline shock family protein YloU
MPERPAAGRAAVTRRAVIDIVRTAVLGSYGVAGFATPTPWGHMVRRLGLGEPGIRVVLDDLRVELRIRVAYGLPIAEVARQVESAVRYALGRDLGREPVDVTIRVDGLVQPDGGLPSPSDLGPEPEPEPDAAQAKADDGAKAGLDTELDSGSGAADPAGATATHEAELPAADGGAAGRVARP